MEAATADARGLKSHDRRYACAAARHLHAARITSTPDDADGASRVTVGADHQPHGKSICQPLLPRVQGTAGAAHMDASDDHKNGRADGRHAGLDDRIHQIVIPKAQRSHGIKFDHDDAVQ